MSQKFYYIDCKEGLLSDNLIVYDSELGVFLTRCSKSNKLLAEKLTVQTVCDGVVQLVCADNKSFWYNPVLNKFYSQPTNFVSDAGTRFAIAWFVCSDYGFIFVANKILSKRLLLFLFLLTANKGILWLVGIVLY